MTGRRSACPTLALCLLLSCRVSSTSTPRSDEPVVLVSPDTGPSERQQRLAALPPASSAPTSDASRLDHALDVFNARTKGRRGYIAVDKPLYQPGETIWFRTFDLASATLAGVERGIMTVQLVSPRGATILETRVLTTAGAAGNAIALPPDTAGGEYILKATSDHGESTERRVIVSSYQPPRIKKKLEFLRKAYGPGDTVVATLALHRATGEALAQKAIVGLVTLDGADLSRTPITTDAEGNALVRFALPQAIAKGDGLLTVLVDDGGVTESVQKRIPITLHDLQLAMFPEGGDLIAGLPARIYFAAKNALDKPADIEGRVVDDRGRLVALLRSFHDGMGRFELVPDASRHYHVEITRPTEIARRFELPDAHASGCGMQAIDDFTSQRTDVRVAVWCSRTQDVAVTATLREARIATATATVTADQPTVIALPVPAGAQGAVRVTVFDHDLAPQAERLVYRNRGADLRITIHPDKPTYHPRDAVALAIETQSPDGKPVAADLALSVVDDTVLAFADDKQATLLAKLYLEAEMPGQKIEEPNFYFGDDPKAPASIDLVLGTSGWRRFDWKPVFAGPPEAPIDEPWAFSGDPWARPRAKAKTHAKAGKVADKEAPEAPPRPPRIEHPAMAAVVPAPAPANKAADETVEVHAAAPMIDPAATVQGITLEADFVRNIPVAGRNFEAVLGRAGGEVVMVRGDDAEHHRRIRGAIRHGGEDEQPDPYCCLEPERVFPVPAYAVRYDGPRTDFRETVLWISHVPVDATGKATVHFVLSDAVTSFKATAEGMGGGKLGRGEALVQSKKPVSLAVTMPLEVSAGDHIRLPVTVANETDQPYHATLTARFGKAFRVASGGLAPKLELAPNERRSTFYELDVAGDGKEAGDGAIAIAVEAANLRDEVDRTIRVVPIGFPQRLAVSGTLSGTAHHEIVISDVLPGTMSGKLTLYPSPLATMVEGSEAMIAEPSGCFEQASSTNYPNIMILGYLEEHDAAQPAVVERAQHALASGYKLLTGYETKTRGYEWFGGDPGHEALTAYGLMEFHDMTKVFGSVDSSMVDRTRTWLRERRDGNGGFRQNPQAIDSFGRASAEVTNAYITYALAESGERNLLQEVAHQKESATTTKDPYLMALATKVLVDFEPKSDATTAAVQRLGAMQAQDGSFPGADHSITRSGGVALDVETTAIATMAMMSGGSHTPEVRRAVEWMEAQRNGGRFGSTQSTVLAMKALALYAKESRVTEASGTVTLRINGTEVGHVAYEKGHQGAIELVLGEYLRTGKNVIEVHLDSAQPLPYSALVTWQSRVPPPDPATKVRLATVLAKSVAHLGEGVHMDVTLTNITDAGLPMTLARIGLPGGLTFQTWQLQELRDKKLIDFYETRPREVILYFRGLAPRAAKAIPLELIASVPGAFTAPASRAYLYYTDEHKHWIDPTAITVAP